MIDFEKILPKDVVMEFKATDGAEKKMIYQAFAELGACICAYNAYNKARRDCLEALKKAEEEGKILGKEEGIR